MSSIVEKIKKLLALGQSNNIHEAELAMKKANELMAEYQITMSEVTASEMSKQTQVHEGDYIKYTEIERPFIHMIGHAVNHIFDTAHLYNAQDRKLYFIGNKDDIVNAIILFNHLHQSWKSIVKGDFYKWKLATTFNNGGEEPKQYEQKKYRMAHGQGFALALLKRAEELKKERTEILEKSNCTALVVQKDQAIKEYMETKKVRTARGAMSHEGEGRVTGYNRGQNIALGGALENN